MNSDAEKYSKWSGIGLSDKEFELTCQQFYGIVDAAVIIEGISIEEVLKLNYLTDQVGVCKFLFPVYVRLRALGFNHYPDLTA